MDFGILVSPVYTPNELVEIVQYAESIGFAHFWYPDEKFYRDCYIGLTLVALNTKCIGLGPCVTDPYSRHPILTAVAIASINEIAKGRTWLGLGAGGRGFQALGIDQANPATAVREAIDVISRLINGESVNYNGKIIQLHDRSLDFKPIGPIPVMIATGYGHSIQMLAGEIADAVMLANFASPETIIKGVERIKLGANRTNRLLDDIYMISRVDVAINRDRDLARTAVAPRILSSIRASYPKLTYLEDLPEFEMSSKFLYVIREKEYRTRKFYSDPMNCASLIPPALFKHMSIAGNHDDVKKQLNDIISLNCFDEITIKPVPSGTQSIIDCISSIQQVISDIS